VDHKKILKCRDQLRLVFQNNDPALKEGDVGRQVHIPEHQKLPVHCGKAREFMVDA